MKKECNNIADKHSDGSQCLEYFVNVTLRIPRRLFGRITKKAIMSKDVEIVAADWDKVREIYSPSAQDQPMTAFNQTLKLPQDAAEQSLAGSHCSTFLANNVARCNGVGFQENDGWDWREGCETCLRRTAKRPKKPWMMEPPAIITFECEYLIEPKQRKDKGLKRKHNTATRSRCLSQFVRPVGLATFYISEHDAPYRMEIRECKGGGRLWAYFYKGKKLVWNCNDGFAKEHFVQSTDENQ
jgi:hypothetical protein